MAKLTLSDIANIVGAESSAITTLNANWDLIETALENTLSRDGTSPNTMSADLDMNSNDINNVATMNVTSLSVNGQAITSAGANGIDWQGAWVTSTAYSVDQGVSNNGSSYICIAAHTAGADSDEPGVGANTATYWNVLASKGDTGASGDMTAAVYDTEAVAEQLVGKTATQTLTNKTLTTPTITLKQSASPTPTAEGDIQWDTDDDVLVVGDGSSQVIFDPVRGLQTFNLLTAGLISRTTNGGALYTEEKATNDVMVKGMVFDQTTSEGAQIMVPMPVSWDAGNMYATFYWTQGASASTGDVIWGIRARHVGDDGAIDGTWGTAVTVTDTWTAAGDLMITSQTSAFTASNTPAAGGAVWFEVYRDAAAGGDTYADDACLIACMIKYTVNVGNDS